MVPEKMDRLLRSKFRVKIRSLAEEARIIRHEEQKHDGQSSDRGILRHHRITVVRSEQRAALLAYAWCRRMPYSVVEFTKSSTPDMKSVQRICKSLGWSSWVPSDEEFAAWMSGDRLAAWCSIRS